MATRAALESAVERFLVAECKRRRAWALKAEGLIAGFPDRMILAHPARVAFVELKAEGEKPRPLQWARIRVLRRLGFEAVVLTTRDEVREFLDDWLGRNDAEV